VAPLLGPLLPLPLETAPSAPAVLRGIAMGLGVTLLSALWPLLAIRRVPPAFILRREVEPPRPALRERLVLVPIALGLAALSVWQAGSWKVGGLFVGAFAGGLLLLWAAARLAVAGARWAARRSARPGARRRALGGLAWRQGLANLGRPGSQAGVVLVTLGLAVMLVVSVAVLEANLRRELDAGRTERAPAFFFIDVQADQVDAFRDRVAGASGGTVPELIPVVRARLAAIRGAPVEADRGKRDKQWVFTREYALTWAAEPPGHGTIVAGRWWTAAEAAREPLISVEDEIAKTLGVRVGDTLTFDVLGVPITARITSLRNVNWRSLGANFFVIFSPGALEAAPRTYLATAHVPPAAEAALQSAVVAAFPNVTAIPVREVLDRVGAVIDQIAVAVRVVAAASVLAGLVVLAGALSVTRAERLYHSVVLKAVGATRVAIARIFAVEYAVLGAAAGLAGTALATALAWGVQRWLLAVPWRWQPATLAAGVLLSGALAVAVGFLGTFRLLGRSPLAVLRGE
jgi:putative ABC transport system permease protein